MAASWNNSGWIKITLGMALMSSCAQTLAQGEASTASRWGLGVATFVSDVPYKKYSTDVLPFPAVSYEGDRFYIRGASIGYKLISGTSSEFSLIASSMGNRFRAKDSDDPALRRLKDRDLSALAGAAYRLSGDWGVLQANALKEVTGHGGGISADLSYAYPITHGEITLTPRIGANYASHGINDYYYGIGSRESLRSGLPAYEASGAAAPYVDFSVARRWRGKWIFLTGVHVAKLPASITDSPMVGKDYVSTLFLSANYHF